MWCFIIMLSVGLVTSKFVSTEEMIIYILIAIISIIFIVYFIKKL